MSRQRFVAGLSAAVLAGWAVTASAASDVDYGRSGPYVGASAAYVIENFDDPAPGVSADNGWGYNIRGGYRFNQIFSLEARWENWLGMDYSPNNPGPAGDDFDGWMLGASGKVFMSDGPFQPYVLAGLGWMSVNDKINDKTGLGCRFGAGIDIYASRNWAITAEADYVLPTGNISGYDLIPISLGFTYRFY